MRWTRVSGSAIAVLGCVMLSSVGQAGATPLFFSGVTAYPGSQGPVDLFSNPGVTLIISPFQGQQYLLSFSIHLAGLLPSGTTDNLSVTSTFSGSGPVTQTHSLPIPISGTVFPPVTNFDSFIFTLAPNDYQPHPMTLAVDLLNSSPDFVIPGGPQAGQMVNSYTYSFNVEQPVPEPATLVLLGSGLAALGGATRRRRK
jgi:PEP-CTERM motif-containing protein